MAQYDNYIIFDIPVPYKGLNIYPVRVKDYGKLNSFSQCLTVDKNSIPDARIISMTYLEYLFKELDKDGTPYLFFLDLLFGLVLQEDKSFSDTSDSIGRYRFDEKGKPFFVINKVTYDSNDFEEIRKIISEQNLIDLPDENIQKEVRDALESAKAYKAKISGTKSGSFEDYIISLAVSTGWSYEIIYQMTVRKFIKSIRRMDNLIHYKIYLASSMSGMVEFKDKSFIIHWLSDLEEGKYDDVSLGLNQVQDKII
jgi:hypothetical protein